MLIFPTGMALKPPFDVGAVVAQAIHDAHMSLTQAWLTMGYKNGSSLTRALQGQPNYSLDLWKLVHLGPAFWYHLGRGIAVALVTHWMTTEWEDAHVRSSHQIRIVAGIGSAGRGSAHLDRAGDRPDRDVDDRDARVVRHGTEQGEVVGARPLGDRARLVG